ncbi:MAG: DUF2127 domain-containing protein [Methanomassiliicoccales archaeon]
MLQSAVMIALSITLSAENGPDLEGPASDGTMTFINVMLVVFGGLGLLTSIGLWTERPWGRTGTIVLSQTMLVFDSWAVLTVQSSAAMGVVLPTVFIVYLTLKRHDIDRSVGL